MAAGTGKKKRSVYFSVSTGEVGKEVKVAATSKVFNPYNNEQTSNKKRS
jgi:hypothetical protein